MTTNAKEFFTEDELKKILYQLEYGKNSYELKYEYTNVIVSMCSPLYKMNLNYQSPSPVEIEDIDVITNDSELEFKIFDFLGNFYIKYIASNNIISIWERNNDDTHEKLHEYTVKPYKRYKFNPIGFFTGDLSNVITRKTQEPKMPKMIDEFFGQTMQFDFYKLGHSFIYSTISSTFSSWCKYCEAMIDTYQHTEDGWKWEITWEPKTILESIYINTTKEWNNSMHCFKFYSTPPRRKYLENVLKVLDRNDWTGFYDEIQTMKKFIEELHAYEKIIKEL